MTTLKVTIDIFSGRENPVIELRGDEASEALRRLKQAHDSIRDAIGEDIEPRLRALFTRT